MWFIGHSRSLKMVPFKSLGTVSYSPSIVTMAASVAVCDIFSVKEWPDLENRIRVCSRSLEIAPIDRSHTSLNTLVACTHVPGICKHKYYTVTFKSGLRVTQGHWKLGYGFLFAFHSNYGCICSHFGDIQRQKWPDLEIWVWGPSRSLKRARFDRPCMTFY